MIAKTVKVKDPYLIKFFYPDFVVREELTYMDRDQKVIYVGKMQRNLPSYLSYNTKQFINTVGVPDLDFNNKEQVLKWEFAKFGKEPTDKIINQVKDCDDEYFMYLVKVFWITGRWVMEEGESENTIYSLFQSTVGSFKQSLQIYFDLINNTPAKVVESSFLTFLSRVYNIEDQSVSVAYMKLLKAASAKYKDKIKPSVYNLALRHDHNEELAFINLLMELR